MNRWSYLEGRKKLITASGCIHWIWKQTSGKKYADSPKKEFNPGLTSPWVLTKTKSSSLEAKAMTPNIISYGNIISKPTPLQKSKLTPVFSLLLEAVIHHASTNIIWLLLEALLVSLIKEMILSSLTSKTNPGKKYGQMNSLNSN